eukprot:TRINITY_DN10236_c0_g1_i1.p1 TRINITY_DN10236_c0_g1~~TRINITY_DN10236_c0_g1_i1.p1  ORF type:complete len:217 (-),score=63.16 TRINITY_DN10236_c0_g1_i1:132-782(-)
MAWVREQGPLATGIHGPPSLLCNNLTCGEAGQAYIHKDEVITLGCGGGMEKVELSRSLRGHTRPVTATAASRTIAASADMGGRIIAWRVADAYAKMCEFSCDGCMVTSMAARDELLVAALSNGTICAFRVAAGELAFEIAAHARIINAIDLHPTQPLLATVGEDAHLNVWSLPDDRSPAKASSQVDLLYSEEVRDHLLTGVAFRKDVPVDEGAGVW